MADTAVAYSEEYLSADLGSHILAATWFMTTLGVIGVSGRLLIRYEVLKKGSADDWWMFSGLIFLVILTAMITRMADLGGFRHEVSMSPEVASTVRKLFWASQPIGLIGSLLPKISIGLQLLFILPQSPSYVWQRWSIYVSIASCAAITVMSFPMSFAQCTPRSALWDPAAAVYPQSPSNPRCWDPSINTAFFTFTAVWNALIDLIFAVIPMALIMGLQIKTLKKVLLVNFLGARCFACISGITRAVYIVRYGITGTGLGTEHDFPWQAFNILLWQVAEQFCLCFCGSVPAYKAMFDRWLHRRNSLRASQSLTYVANEADQSGDSGGHKEKDWFYERNCFDEVEDSRIVITTEINVECLPRGSGEQAEQELKSMESVRVAPGV